MSIDTFVQLRTSLAAAQVRAALVQDPALADLGLVDHGERVGIGGDWVSLVVKPWQAESHELIEDGFEAATVWVKLIPKWGEEGWDAVMCVLAAILRLVPGDVCLAGQDNAGPDLLRLDGVVYVNPDGFRADNLDRYGYRPERVVTGIPPRTVGTAAQ